MSTATKDGDKRILVVDDDDQVLFVWSNALASARDITLVTAQDGQEALEILDQDGFDVIITDLRMPRMDGYELTEAIRRQDQDITIVWLTGYRDPSRTPMEQRLKVHRCVDKPLTVAQIRSLVREAVEVAEAGAARQP